MKAMNKPKNPGPLPRTNYFSPFAKMKTRGLKKSLREWRVEMQKCVIADSEDWLTSPKLDGARPRTQDS
jgi:hypothetical protein